MEKVCKNCEHFGDWGINFSLRKCDKHGGVLRKCDKHGGVYVSEESKMPCFKKLKLKGQDCPRCGEESYSIKRSDKTGGVFFRCLRTFCLSGPVMPTEQEACIEWNKLRYEDNK